MELPKNITQIGETNPYCKVYVEDYVISYIKQLNQYANEKEMAVALYGVRKEEAGITYLFLYGASRLVFLQKECRHLSQAVLQEAEKQRKKFFPDTVFLGYRLLDGEMIEGFHICEQGVCRYVGGYAQFYEKNDAMLAFMLEERQEASKPEIVDQEKYNVVKRRQEERRALAEEKSGHAILQRRKAARTEEAASQPAGANARLKGMRLTAAAVFTLLCATGLAAMGNGEKLEEWQTAVRQLMENMSEQQLPDAVQVSNGTAQVGTIVAEDRLNDAILNENAAANSEPADPGQSSGQGTPQDPVQSSGQGTPQDPVQSSGQGTPQDPVQSSGQGTPQDPGQSSGQGTSQDPEQSSDENGSQTGENADGNSAGQEQGQPPSREPESGEGTGQQGEGSDNRQEPTDQMPQDNEGQAAPDNQTQETKPAAGPTAELDSYIVQKGDTLIGICVKRYGSDTRVSEICSLNNIENPDDIKVGEKIFLPQ